MEILGRGKQVICKKYVYNKEKKRTYPVTVAKQPIGLSTVSEDVVSLVSDPGVDFNQDDLDELTNWLHERERKHEVAGHQAALNTVVSFIDDAAEALDNGITFEDVRVNEQAVYAAVDNLKKAMRAAGYKADKDQVKKLGDERYGGKVRIVYVDHTGKKRSKRVSEEQQDLEGL